jgi:hypothetical protein
METAPGQFIACGRGRAGRGGDAMGGVKDLAISVILLFSLLLVRFQ